MSVSGSGGGGVSDSGFTDKNWWSGSMSAKTSSNASSGTEEENLNIHAVAGSSRFPGVAHVGGYPHHIGAYPLQGFYNDPSHGLSVSSHLLTGGTATSTTNTIATSTASGTTRNMNATTTSSGSVSALEDELSQLLDVIQLKSSELRVELSDVQKKNKIYEGDFDPGGAHGLEFLHGRLGNSHGLTEDVHSDPSHTIRDPTAMHALPEDRMFGEPLWPLSLPPFSTKPGSSGEQTCKSPKTASRFPSSADDLIHPAAGINSSPLRHLPSDSSPRHHYTSPRTPIHQATNHQLVSSLVSRASLAEKEASESQQRLTDLHACLNLLLAEKRKLEKELARRTANERLLFEAHGQPYPDMSGVDPMSFYRPHESYPPSHYVPYRPYGVIPSKRVQQSGIIHPFLYQDPIIVNPHSFPQAQAGGAGISPQASPSRVVHGPQSAQNIALPRIRKIPIRDANKVAGDLYRKHSKSVSSSERKQARGNRTQSADAAAPNFTKDDVKLTDSNNPDEPGASRVADEGSRSVSNGPDEDVDDLGPLQAAVRPRSKSLSNMKSSRKSPKVPASSAKGTFPRYHLAPSGMLSTATRAPSAVPPRLVRGIQSLPPAVRVSPQGRVSVTPNRSRIAAILKERNVLELQRQLLHTVMEAEVTFRFCLFYFHETLLVSRDIAGIEPTSHI